QQVARGGEEQVGLPLGRRQGREKRQHLRVTGHLGRQDLVGTRAPPRLPGERQVVLADAARQIMARQRHDCTVTGVRQGVSVARMAPFVPTWKPTAPGPASRTTARSRGSGASASLTRAAASRTAAPLEMAIATARRNADSRSDGRFTAAAAYVRPVSSRTAAPSAAATPARAE